MTAVFVAEVGQSVDHGRLDADLAVKIIFDQSHRNRRSESIKSTIVEEVVIVRSKPSRFAFL